MGPKGKKWIKRLLILFLIRVMFSGVLYYVIVYRFKEIVQIAVNNESRGLYAFDASHIDFSLFKRHLQIQDARVYCTDTLHTPLHYEVHIPAIHLAIQSWRSLIFHQRVLVDSLRIDYPVINAHGHNLVAMENRKTDVQPGQIIAVLKSMTRHLQIKKLKVVDGSYEYRNLKTDKPFYISHVNFLLRNFSRKNNTKEHFFSSERIELSLSKQHWFLPEGRFDISFKRLKFNGKSQFFELDSCVFNAAGADGKAATTVRAEKFLFNSSQLTAGFSTKQLMIDTLICVKPEVILNYPPGLQNENYNSHNMKHTLPVNEVFDNMFKNIHFKYIYSCQGQFSFKNAPRTFNCLPGE